MTGYFALPFFLFSVLSQVSATSVTTRALQNTTQTEEEQVCEAFRKLFYSTGFETQNNPCTPEGCTFDITTNQLDVECRYDYCQECSEEAGVCAVRVVKYSRTLEDELEMLALINGQNSFKLDAVDYCVEYVEGRTGNPVCTTVGRFTEVNCENIDNIQGGPPLLLCDETQCSCLESRDKVDYDTPFVGFATIPFQSCYNANAPAIKSLSDNSGTILVSAKNNYVWPFMSVLGVMLALKGFTI